MRPTRLIESECSRRSDVYGRPELVFSSTAIGTVYCSFCGMGMGRPVSSMIAYSIGILQVIKNLKQEIPDITQSWYADDAVNLGMFARLETYFDSLIRHGPGWDNHPNPTKSVLIVRPENLEAGKLFGACHRFRMCTCAHYLGGYIGDGESKHNLLRERMLTWEKNISRIS